MFLRDNLIHGDLHGGNVMYNSKNDIVGIVDGGLVTGVEREVRADYFAFLKALCKGDVDDLVERLVSFSEKKTLSPEKIQAFRDDVEIAVKRWIGKGGKDHAGGPIQLGDLMGELLFKIQKHKMSLRCGAANLLSACIDLVHAEIRICFVHA
jgi:predicted unusual protein kinase regulating ubiquinone biosynthesis (AarF/ABC1/UbiB family)